MTDTPVPASGPFGSVLGRRILLVLAAVLTICSLLFLTLFVLALRSRLIEGHERASIEINTLLEASLKNAMLNRDLEGLRSILAEIGKEQNVANVYVLNSAGVVRFATDGAAEGKAFADAAGEAVQPARPGTTSTLRHTPAGHTVLRSVNPVMNEPRCQQCHGSVQANPVNGLLVVDYAADDVVRDYWRAGLLLAAAGFAVLLAALGTIMSAIKRNVLVPVASIGVAANRFAAGDLEARTPATGSDELSVLAGQFNAMAEQVGRNVRAVQVNERFLQDVLDAVPDGMRVIGPDYRILKANAAYFSQLGETPEHSLGQPCHLSSHKLKVPCSPTLVPCPMAELQAGKRISLKCRHRHVRADGSELFVEVSAARVLLEQDGKALPCVIESIRDLSNQAEASHGQRLAEIGQLATGIAHEIHNPLWSIHLAMEAIRNDMAARGEDTSADSYIATADREIKRCLDVTGRLLRVSEPSSQEQVLLDLAPLLKDVVALLTYQAQQSGVKISLAFDGNPRAITNESDLGIVFVNLAQNAIHAMPRGGQLDIAAGATGGRVDITFRDTGVGIAADDLQRIFWPFWSKRADGSTGTGLGLSICHSTVERMKGELTVKSTPGEGSTFRVSLPDPDFSGEPEP
jgi:signal transduction histidine kinase